jgi:small conductance mechanosensitive channel
MEKYFDHAIELIMSYGPKFILAIITLIIGLWIIKFISKWFVRFMNKRNVDKSLKTFLKSMVSIPLKILLIISVASMIGIATTSFIAIIGAAGLAVGLALSGTLQNFAGGVIILLFKPYKVGDFIQAQGHSGSVREIQIFNTILKTPDNKTIVIPNAQLSNGSIINFSTEPIRRVDMTFGIGYNDDIDKARQTIINLIKADSRILNEPAEPFIAISALADSSVNFVVRVWANSSDYWSIYYEMQENIKKTFDKENISIPFPQQDVHLHPADISEL